jgi:hypothetical protein
LPLEGFFRLRRRFGFEAVELSGDAVQITLVRQQREFLDSPNEHGAAHAPIVAERG